MINPKDENNIKPPLEALADFLTEVWILLRADLNKSPQICYDCGLSATNDFNKAQAAYVESVEDKEYNLILISPVFATADWNYYGETVKKAVHELYHAYQVQILGRTLNCDIIDFKAGEAKPEYFTDKNEIEAHAFDEWFEQYWLKITTENEHIPAMPDCDLLPKYRFEKEYRRFESKYGPGMMRNSKKWDLLTIELLRSLKLLKK